LRVFKAMLTFAEGLQVSRNKAVMENVMRYEINPENTDPG